MDDHAPKTTVRLTGPAPIIVGAMEQAGTMAQRAAERIQQGAIMDRLEAAGQLIDALGRDIYPGGNVPSTSAQRDWRTRLSDQIARLDDDAFSHLVNVLADGRGPEEGARWRDAAGMKLRAFADGLRNDAIDAGEARE